MNIAPQPSPSKQFVLQQRQEIGTVVGDERVQEFCKTCHISLRFRYMYAAVPKAGSSSIKGALHKAELDDEQYHPHGRVHVRRISPLLNPMMVPQFSLRMDKLYKFCFVRDPATRLIAAYLNKIVGNGPQKRQILEILGKEDQPATIPSFSEFIDAVGASASQDLNRHWCIQYTKVCADKIAYDKIGRFERLSEDLQQILTMLQIGRKYSSLRFGPVTQAEHRAQEFLTPSIRRKIEEIYHLDYENFGYRTTHGTSIAAVVQATKPFSQTR